MRELSGAHDFPGELMIPVKGGAWVPDKLKLIAAQVHMRYPELILQVRCNRASGRPVGIDLFEKCRDGMERWVTRWSMSELDNIIPDIMRSDREAPGHVPVGQLVRDNHDRMFAKAAREGDDLIGEFADRVEGVKRYLNGTNTFHGQAGFGESKQVQTKPKLIVVERG